MNNSSAHLLIKRPVLNYFLIKMDTPYKIPNLENQKNDVGTSQKPFFITLPPESLLKRAQYFTPKFNENITNIIFELSTRKHLIWFVSTNHVLPEHFWKSRNQAVWSLWEEQKQKRMERSRKFTNLILVILMPEICQILWFSPRIPRHILNIPYRNLEFYLELKKISVSCILRWDFKRIDQK